MIDKDDVVWVCDRPNHRIQMFRKDGTFLREVSVAPLKKGVVPLTLSLNDGKGGAVKVPMGSVFDLAFSRDADQRFAFVPDAQTETVWILRRSDGKTIGSIGHAGHWGGGFTLAHNIAVDSRNHLYVTESAGGARVQRFLYKGLRSGDRSKE
jgi:hypothetical protein